MKKENAGRKQLLALTLSAVMMITEVPMNVFAASGAAVDENCVETEDLIDDPGMENETLQENTEETETNSQSENETDLPQDQMTETSETMSAEEQQTDPESTVESENTEMTDSAETEELTYSTDTAEMTEGQTEENEEAADEKTLASDADFVVSGDGELTKYTGTDEDIVIPDGVVTIGASVFKGNTTIKTVTFSSTVETVGNSAFQGCSSLRTVELNEGLKTIGENAFSGAAFGEKSETGAETYGTLTIPGTVESIGYKAFYNCTYLREVTFENGENVQLTLEEDISMKSSAAFAGCANLKTVILPDRLKKIGNSAFSNCTKLTEVSFGKNLEVVGISAFQGCSSLRAMQMNEGLKTIGESAFSGAAFGEKSETGAETCDPLTIPGTVESIGYKAFYNCTYLGEVTFANGENVQLTLEEDISRKSSAAFAGCANLKTVILPDRLKKIGNSAFYYCRKLTDVTFGEGLEIIGDVAFSECTELKNVNVNEKITQIGNSAFYHCGNLKPIELTEGLVTIGDSAFSGAAFGEKLETGAVTYGTLTIPSTVQSIGNSAFSNCAYLEEVVFANGANEVLTIGSGSVVLSSSVFTGCGNLKRVELPERLKTIQVYMFWKCTNLKDVTIGKKVEVISENAFAGCSSLKPVELNEGLKTIGDYAFSGAAFGEKLETGAVTYGTLTIPSTVQSIGRSAFSNCAYLEEVVFANGANEVLTISSDPSIASSLFTGCGNLKRVELPERLKTVQANMFYECQNLKDVTIGRAVEVIDEFAFFKCSSLKPVELNEGLKTIGDYAFSGAAFGEKSETGEVTYGKLTIPSTVQSIGRSVFTNCAYLEEVVFANGDNVVLTISNDSISSSLFMGCGNLKRVELPERLKTIQQYMFQECTNLKDVIIGKKVEEIGPNAFSGCSSLMPVELNEGLKTIGDYAFYGAAFGEKLETGEVTYGKLAIPSTVQSIGRNAFTNCAYLEEVVFENGETVVLDVGSNVFNSCPELTSVMLPERIASLKYMSFYNLPKLQILYIPETVTDIAEGAISNCPNLTIYGVPGSAAETYANNNNIPFKNKDELNPLLKVTSVELTPAVIEEGGEAAIGKQIQLYAKVLPISAQNKKVTYQSDNEEVAVVDGKGLVTITGFGQAKVTVTTEDGGKTAVCEVTVLEKAIVTYTVTFNMNGHGTAISDISVREGSLLEKPQNPRADGYTFTGWYKDQSCTDLWDFATDTVQSDTTLYAGWEFDGGNTDNNAPWQIAEILPTVYTGSVIKPTVTIYNSDGMLLKVGKDYTVAYQNNINADTVTAAGGMGSSVEDTAGGFNSRLPYIIITGKGNYRGSVYKNFHIEKASISDDGEAPATGFTLKYTEQFVKADKVQKPFTSIRFKKAMTAGTDYDVKFSKYAADGSLQVISTGSTIPVISANATGVFQLVIIGKGNYSGTITKDIYVGDKNSLMKNAKITLGKNVKSFRYTGSPIELTAATQNGVDVFTVKLGSEYLTQGMDYTVSYKNNTAVGTATIIVRGSGKYIGTKTATFKITGTPFKAKDAEVIDFKNSMTYTGSALEQGKAGVRIGTRVLDYGTDYSVTYKNNVKKGTATVTFRAKPESGYSGSFNKTFKILAADMAQSSTKVTFTDYTVSGTNADRKLNESVMYSKAGAKPAGDFSLTGENGRSLLLGTDYTVSYAGNKKADSQAVMTIKGKGNYTGQIKITYTIEKAPLDGNGNVTESCTPVVYNDSKADNYLYKPKFKVWDTKKALAAKTDYEVLTDASYKNCTQAEVKAYLRALENGSVTGEALEAMRPYVVITGAGSYTGTRKVSLTVYKTKLTKRNLKITVNENTTSYTGKQVRPEITVIVDGKQLEKGRDYTLAYGTNITAGKNKGTVTVNGTGLYGGSVTTKFTIQGRDVNKR